MAEAANKKDKAPKKEKKAQSWIKGLKSEFGKIIWLDKQTIFRQTTAVVAITLFLGVVITALDSIVMQLINLLIK